MAAPAGRARLPSLFLIAPIERLLKFLFTNAKQTKTRLVVAFAAVIDNFFEEVPN